LEACRRALLFDAIGVHSLNIETAICFDPDFDHVTAFANAVLTEAKTCVPGTAELDLGSTTDSLFSLQQLERDLVSADASRQGEIKGKMG
jgi:hypothetical protein